MRALATSPGAYVALFYLLYLLSTIFIFFNDFVVLENEKKCC